MRAAAAGEKRIKGQVVKARAFHTTFSGCNRLVKCPVRVRVTLAVCPREGDASESLSEIFFNDRGLSITISQGFSMEFADLSFP